MHAFQSFAYCGLDRITQGTWTGSHGHDGYMIANDATRFPAYTAASVAGGFTYTGNLRVGNLYTSLASHSVDKSRLLGNEMPSCKKLVKAIAILGTLYALTVGGVSWFSGYMHEGILENEALRGYLLVALRNDENTLTSLRASCVGGQLRTDKIQALLRDGKLIEIDSGTAADALPWNDDTIGAVFLTEGPWNKHTVWMCRNEFTLRHAWP